eukprot:COSAG01_NODE_16359_length_1242_cov_8.299213_1_plen_94_part_10
MPLNILADPAAAAGYIMKFWRAGPFVPGLLRTEDRVRQSTAHRTGAHLPGSQASFSCMPAQPATITMHCPVTLLLLMLLSLLGRLPGSQAAHTL